MLCTKVDRDVTILENNNFLDGNSADRFLVRSLTTVVGFEQSVLIGFGKGTEGMLPLKYSHPPDITHQTNFVLNTAVGEHWPKVQLQGKEENEMSPVTVSGRG